MKRLQKLMINNSIDLYYTTSDKNNEVLLILKDILKENLPTYMIPVRYFKVNGFCYSQNGKIDRKIFNI